MPRRTTPQVIFLAASAAFLIIFQLPSSQWMTVTTVQPLTENAKAQKSNCPQSIIYKRPRGHSELGHWIGNQWIPPFEHGWRLFSAEEMKRIYSNATVLWIGDSTARRSFTTLYAILNETDPLVSSLNSPRVIDVNKRANTENCSLSTAFRLCRPFPGISSNPTPTGEFSFLFKADSCLGGLGAFLEQEISGESNLTANTDVIVISLGIWEAIRASDCQRERKRLNQTASATESQRRVIDLLTTLLATKRRQQQQQRPPVIIWRTSGFHGIGAGTNIVKNLNNDAMKQIEATSHTSRSGQGQPVLTYVDWGGAMWARSFGKQRIDGDIAAHYGLEARHTLIQMINNELVSHWR